MNYPAKKVRKITEKIFGQNGLLTSSTEVEFDLALDEFSAEHEDLMARSYMVNFMQRIRKNILLPHILTNIGLRHEYGKNLHISKYYGHTSKVK